MSELYRSFEDILDECIAAIERGEATIESCVAGHPQHEAELRELLEVMLFFQSAPAVSPAPALRQRQLPDILQRPQVRKKKAWWGRLWAERRRQASPRIGWVMAVLVVLILGMSTLSAAADSAVPGDALYGVDRGVESLRLGLAPGGPSRVELLLAQAEERLLEAGILLERGEDKAVDETLQDYDRSLAGAIETAISTGSSTAAPIDTAAETGNELLAAIDKSHPVTRQTAAAYGVKAEQISAWRDAGYGFGQIKLALSTAAATGQDAAQLLTINAQGKKWSSILEDERQKSPAQVTPETEKEERKITREAGKEEVQATREAQKEEIKATREAQKEAAKAAREAERAAAKATREAGKAPPGRKNN